MLKPVVVTSCWAVKGDGNEEARSLRHDDGERNPAIGRIRRSLDALSAWRTLADADAVDGRSRWFVHRNPHWLHDW